MRRIFAILPLDENGSVLVEAAIMAPIIFMLVLGSMDLLFAFYEWNAAAKAVQVGARIAAASDPVALGLNGLGSAAVSPSSPPGSPMPPFAVTCDGSTQTCICSGQCAGVVGYDANAMSTIVYGRGSSACNDSAYYYNAGMCDFLSRITPANVVIVYQWTGLGYAGRAGPVPTITISLQNLQFQFVLLRGLFGDIAIPGLTTSITAEDLSSNAF